VSLIRRRDYYEDEDYEEDDISQEDDDILSTKVTICKSLHTRKLLLVSSNKGERRKIDDAERMMGCE